MKRRSASRNRRTGTEIRDGRRRALIALGLVLAISIVAGLVENKLWRQPSQAATSNNPNSTSGAAQSSPRFTGRLTFNRDIAPIIYRECSGCHRLGDAAPFPFLNYADVRDRAADIVAVTGRGYMPPWLPSRAGPPLMGERRLTTDEIGAIRRWVEEGKVEGAAADRITPPQWTDGWRLGTPDLVVDMPATYTLPGAGRDVYRNFVIPLNLPAPRFVRAFEFRPNTRVLHHVFIRFDRTQQSRRWDAADAEVGFGGIAVPPGVESIGGQFLSWQPGRGPTFSPEGLAWRLEPGRDLILQSHLQPSGRPEPVRPQIGFYFTNQPPTNLPFKLVLSSLEIDIPAGARRYEIQDSYVVPVDIDLLAVLPHAHYLAREIEGYAVRPDGTRQTLIEIKEWDFNWQSDYRYREPVFLPKGTQVGMRFTYDNSNENLRNPSHPPAPVRFGLQSTNEMGELWLQLLPRKPEDRQRLESDCERRVMRDVYKFNSMALRQNPTNAHAHVQVAKVLIVSGRADEAMTHLKQAVQIDPNDEEGHYHIGVVLMDRDPAGAAQAFQETVRVNPENFKAHNNLGLVLMRSGRWAEAEAEFQRALELNPGDQIVLDNLKLVRKQGR